jgi:hypothetical protein
MDAWKVMCVADPHPYIYSHGGVMRLNHVMKLDGRAVNCWKRSICSLCYPSCIYDCLTVNWKCVFAGKSDSKNSRRNGAGMSNLHGHRMPRTPFARRIWNVVAEWCLEVAWEFILSAGMKLSQLELKFIFPSWYARFSKPPNWEVILDISTSVCKWCACSMWTWVE